MMNCLTSLIVVESYGLYEFRESKMRRLALIFVFELDNLSKGGW